MDSYPAKLERNKLRGLLEKNDGSHLVKMIWNPKKSYFSYTESVNAPETAEVKVRKGKGK